jgi:hypothetical protein
MKGRHISKKVQRKLCMPVSLRLEGKSVSELLKVIERWRNLERKYGFLNAARSYRRQHEAAQAASKILKHVYQM